MKAGYALLLLLSIVGRIVIFLALVAGLLVLSPLIFLVSLTGNLTIKLLKTSRRSKRPAGLPPGSCGSLSDDFIARIATSRDSSERDRRK